MMQPSHAPAPPAPATTWTNLTPAEKRIAVQSMQGASARAIADRYATTRNAVLGFRRRQGIGTLARVLRAERRSNKATRLESATRMLAERHDVSDVAMAIGVSEQTLRNLLREAGKPLKITRLEARFPVHPLPPPETWLPFPGAVPSDSSGCQWPIEVDGKRVGCCGLAVHRKSYCEQHYRTAYPVSMEFRAVVPRDHVVRNRPISSMAAMRLAGVPARHVEAVE